MIDEADKKKHEAEEAAPETAPEEESALEAELEQEQEGEGEALSAEAARIDELEEQLGQAKDALLRSLAEMENLRRRAQREKEEALKYAPAGLARGLLPVADNLRRALEAVPEELKGEEKLAGLLSGVEMTERELLSAFAKNGIERIDPLGEKLDPNWHEAMFEVPDAEKPAGTIVQVVEVGYRLQDRLLRPARVGVSRRP